MRDKRCNIKIVKERLDYLIKEVESDFKRIEEFTKYVEDKLYGTDETAKYKKLSLINTNYSSVIKCKLNIINYKYTLGEDLSELHKEYLGLLDQIDKIKSLGGYFFADIVSLGILFEEGIEKFEKLIIIMDEFKSNDLLFQIDKIKSLGGYFFADIVSLGILFEEGIEKFEKLIIIMDEFKSNDLLFDYLINGCGLKRKYYSKVFELDRFKFSKELIELAQKDREQASKKLVHHFKTYWNEPVKPPRYKGYWLWEYAAISKMFKLDDSELKDNPHYPYELAHYKDEMEFMPEKMLDFPKETYKKGIPEYPRLEKLIPAKFHEITNNFFVDFKTLSNEEFCEKYELDWLDPDEYAEQKDDPEVFGTNLIYFFKTLSNEEFCEKYELDWLDPDEYAEQKDDPEVFGTNLIYFLTDNGYILGFEKLDDLEHVDLYKNFWGKRKVKPVRFDLKCDCYYIAYIPKSVKLKSIFGIKIDEVKDLKELDQYEKYFGQFDN